MANDGILTRGYCLKVENTSSSDFLTGTVRDFGGLEREESLRQQQNVTYQSEPWQQIAALSQTQNWKRQILQRLSSPCVQTLHNRSEIRYNLIDCYCVFVDCMLQRSANLLPFAAAEGEGREVQMRVPGKTSKKRVGKGPVCKKNEGCNEVHVFFNVIYD